MSLPIKKIYVDSKHKLSTSASNSDFKVELKESYLMPEGAVFKICDVCIPHSWTTIMTGINDKFYFYVSNTNPISTRPQTGYIATLDAENLSGTEFATKLASAMNTEYGSNVFSVAYNVLKQSITISTSVSNMTFKIMTENDIKTKLDGDWPNGLDNTPTDYDANKPNDINTNMLKLNSGNAPLNTHSVPFESTFINLQPIRNLYLTSPNLGNYNTVDLRGDRTILKKIPVTAGFNQMIFDNVAYDDYLDCSRQLIQTMNFRLQDGLGNMVPLGGTYISFSIIFDVLLK